MGIRRITGRIIGAVLRRLRAVLVEAESNSCEVPFDNRSDWIGATFERVRQDPTLRERPHYTWGVLQGCALAKVLGYERISVIEFGVAAGAGLLFLERIAEYAEKLVGIQIEVYGFDTGIGLPKPVDYRDCPNLWLDGQFPMDVQALSARLRKATLKLGLIKDTLPLFLQNSPAPVAFASIDVDLYSSANEVLQLFEAPHHRLLPRVVCYFDDIMGRTYSDYNGERLAIKEFNDGHSVRKLSPQYGLKYSVPYEHINYRWPECMYLAHMFDHPLYNEHDELRKPMRIDITGKHADWRASVRTNSPGK
jgi:hypothetical protein